VFPGLIIKGEILKGENVEEYDKPAAYFKRYEQKYLLNQDQYLNFMDLTGDSFQPDQYGPSTIYSVYYDTPDFRIIRRAFTKSGYREKLRLRSYGIPKSDDRIYIEMKKKYQGITYKRRFPVYFGTLENLYTLPPPPAGKRDLFDEFDYFYRRYPVVPSFFISCDRFALEGKTDKRLRLTFDTNIRWRSDNFDFSFGTLGHPLLKANKCLMELKTIEPIPLYVSRCLTKSRIFPVSFSKSKLAYLNFISNRYKGMAL
jgi:hypothetical protein